MAGTVGDRGQVTIEKRIRDELGIYAGDRAVQRVEGGRVVLEIVPGPHRRSLAGTLRQKVTRRPPDEADWERIRKTALDQSDPDRTPAGRRRRRS